LRAVKGFNKMSAYMEIRSMLDQHLQQQQQPTTQDERVSGRESEEDEASFLPATLKSFLQHTGASEISSRMDECQQSSEGMRIDSDEENHLKENLLKKICLLCDKLES